MKLDVLVSDLDRDVLVSAERYRIGVTLSEADDTLRQQLRLATGEGLVVTEVVADSSAAQAGLQMNDVLTMLDGKRLTTVEAINEQIQELKDKSVELRLLRGGKETTIQIAARKIQEAAFADRPLVYWSTKSCQNCHVADATHQALGWKLSANSSAWTDGHHSKLWLYEKAFRAQTEAAAQQTAANSAAAATRRAQIAARRDAEDAGRAGAGTEATNGTGEERLTAVGTRASAEISHGWDTDCHGYSHPCFICVSSVTQASSSPVPMLPWSLWPCGPCSAPRPAC